MNPREQSNIQTFKTDISLTNTDYFLPRGWLLGHQGREVLVPLLHLLIEFNVDKKYHIHYTHCTWLYKFLFTNVTYNIMH